MQYPALVGSSAEFHHGECAELRRHGSTPHVRSRSLVRIPSRRLLIRKLTTALRLTRTVFSIVASSPTFLNAVSSRSRHDIRSDRSTAWQRLSHRRVCSDAHCFSLSGKPRARVQASFDWSGQSNLPWFDGFLHEFIDVRIITRCWFMTLSLTAPR